ncbi:hypothetical protein [Paenibacillus sp. LHD-38]|uniref:hypothetical protein n=1 Tax=Paenibacillus sp. LHD-38 TaxID=3072143 RepID=UPI00280FC4F1|nr:hypothetical protein [Paenibacillus sp. LHD-38]MDQ8737147.1 hypothetical protein [Paenibacillus sp. LHD-38]
MSLEAAPGEAMTRDAISTGAEALSTEVTPFVADAVSGADGQDEVGTFPWLEAAVPAGVIGFAAYGAIHLKKRQRKG